ncbi:hypothetical protein DFH94DRAFT_841594 [Russula ochroleuca]|uniref:Uncharacterized protein n=1 Tax=Russula ochroleuca TaxID=152965 RepID=A0A9P5N6R9_9AGAM|nr:hypothetical protein DFH94DRAFT_841594 [Russula ochroleuca]
MHFRLSCAFRLSCPLSSRLLPDSFDLVVPVNSEPIMEGVCPAGDRSSGSTMTSPDVTRIFVRLCRLQPWFRDNGFGMKRRRRHQV